MLGVVRGIGRIGGMWMREAARHHDWTLRRAFQLLVLPPLLLVTHIPLHRRVLTVGKLPDFHGMTKYQPRFLYKYLNNLYLVRGLGVKARGEAFIRHYHTFAAAFDRAFLSGLQEGQVPLMAAERGGVSYEITMCQSLQYMNEGEVSLHFCADGEVIYIAAFTIVPGWTLEIDTDSALLVTRLQGSRGKFGAISKATKDLMDLTPQFILFSALQGIAMVLGISYIGSVSGARHISNEDPQSPLFHKAYDDFMVSQGAVGSADDLFRLQVPVREKPLNYIKRDHRARTLRKRRFRTRIVRDVSARLHYYLRPGFEPGKGL